MEEKIELPRSKAEWPVCAVDEVRSLGEYLARNAEKIIQPDRGKVSLSVKYVYDGQTIPVLTVTHELFVS